MVKKLDAIKINDIAESSNTAHTCYRYDDKTKGKRDLVIFEDKPVNNCINEKFSSRALHRCVYS